MQKRVLSLILCVIISGIFYPSCKSVEDDYDIRDEWNFYTQYGTIYKGGTIVFEGGSESSGTVKQGNGSGTWTVNDKQINFSITYIENVLGKTFFTFTGTLTKGNLMSGTVQVVHQDQGNQTFSGTWEANR